MPWQSQDEAAIKQGIYPVNYRIDINYRANNLISQNKETHTAQPAIKLLYPSRRSIILILFGRTDNLLIRLAERKTRRLQ